MAAAAVNPHPKPLPQNEGGAYNRMIACNLGMALLKTPEISTKLLDSSSPSLSMGARGRGMGVKFGEFAIVSPLRHSCLLLHFFVEHVGEINRARRKGEIQPVCGAPSLLCYPQ